MRSLCELAGGCCTARWVLHLTWDVEQCVVNEFLPVKSINPPADPCQLKAPFKSWVVMTTGPILPAICIYNILPVFLDTIFI